MINKKDKQTDKQVNIIIWFVVAMFAVLGTTLMVACIAAIIMIFRFLFG